MGHSKRVYRYGLKPANMSSFNITIKETDLWIAVNSSVLEEEPELLQQLEQFVWQQRRVLEEYIKKDPLFFKSIYPYMAGTDAPRIAKEMAKAANLAGVGPMAAVAGAFAQFVGQWLLQKSPEVIVENGGDIFIRSNYIQKVGVFAGESPFSEKLAVTIPPSRDPLGICTSSSTVGPSLSFGKVDAAVSIATSSTLADAAATAAGNMVYSEEDLTPAMDFALSIVGVKGALVILGDKMAVRGDIQLSAP